MRNRITQAEERIAALDREARRLEDETTTAHQQLENVSAASAGSLDWSSSRRRSGWKRWRRRSTRTACCWSRSARPRRSGKQHLDSLRAEYAGLIGKKGSLEAVITEHGYSTESVRRLFKSGAMTGGMAPVGVLADFLEVEDRYEHVVDDFLRDELNFIVVKSWDAADEGLAAAAQRCGWPGDVPGASGRFAGEVLVPAARKPAIRVRSAIAWCR